MRKHSHIVVMALAGVSALPVVARAQPSDTAPAQAESSSQAQANGVTGAGVGEIVVTAQRREQALQRVPVSVAVVSSESLAKAQVVSEQDLRSQAPGLNIRATSNSNQVNYVIRGQSLDAFSDARPGVVPYFNEVQTGGAGGTTAFYDLQSVQVLKGPQGTLFGRSATGGAVLFTTAKPTEELSGYVSASLGNYGSQKFEGAISGALIPGALAVRVAGIYQSRDGFQRNLFDGGREGDVKRKGVRGSATGQFGDVRNELVVEYLRSTGSSTVGVISGIFPQPSVPGQILYGGTADPAAAASGPALLAAATGQPVAAATAFYNAYFADPRHPNTGLVGVLAAQNARGPFVVDVDGRNEFRAKNVIVSNTTTVPLADSITLKNILGYSHNKVANWIDFDGTPFNFASNGFRDRAGPSGAKFDVEAFSEELQLSGNVLDDRLNFVLGGYFATDRFEHDQDAYYFDMFFGGIYQKIAYTTKTKARAAYGEGTYKVNDSGLSLILGARYTSERVTSITDPDSSARLALGNPPPPRYSYHLQDTFKNLSWRAGVQQQINRATMVYGSVSRAFRAGGFNGVPAPLIGTAKQGGVAYGEEQVTAAELGAKFAGTVAEMPVRMNLAAFYTWVKNNQRVAYTVVEGAPASLTANVPKAKVYGLEFDSYIRPVEWLSLGAIGGYIRSSFGGDLVFLNGSPQIYDQVPDTPRFTGTFYADVQVPLKGNISLLGHADYYIQSKSTTVPQSLNSFGTTLPGYRLLNLRLGLEDVTTGWSLIANVKNVLKREYYVGGLPNGTLYGPNTRVPGEPRTFTIEARYKF